MAKYNVTYKCGCSHEIQLFGSYDQRDAKLEWLATQDCPNCKKQQELNEATSYAEANNLPLLEGSEKQVNWATTLRFSAHKALDTLSIHASATDAKKLIELWRREMNSKTESKWWIEHRDAIPQHSSDTRAMISGFVNLFGQNSKNQN